MRTFEASLSRVLDPDGFYWRYPRDEVDDPTRVRLIEIRLDVPTQSKESAVAGMSSGGWSLSSAPDNETDPLERLYFRMMTTVETEQKKRFLSAALRVAYDTNGTLMTWINVEDLEED